MSRPSNLAWRAALQCLPLLPLLLSATPARAADAVGQAFNPYAADVRKALAPQPGESVRPALDLNGNESPACRDLRMKIERARSGPPAPQYDVYPEGPLREGGKEALRQPNPIPGGITGATSRQTFLKPGGGNASAELGQLEGRYAQECR